MVNERGASILEVLLTLAIIAMVAPFLYFQVSDISRQAADIRVANQIISLREPALNFVRINQTEWPTDIQIKLDSDELAAISPDATAGFVDRYDANGAIMTDVYLAFNVGDATMAAQIAKQIGSDAAVVNPDGAAYAKIWAASAPDWDVGDLVYRIAYSFSGEDNAKYLHRATTGEDDFNVMLRTLNMNNFDTYNVGTVAAESVIVRDAFAAFAAANLMSADSIYFARGANLDGNSIEIGALRVSGDTTGFRNITALRLNGDGFGTSGNIITDRANISNSVNVAGRMNIKAEMARTISGFIVINAHSVAVPFMSVGELTFFNDFGLIQRILDPGNIFILIDPHNHIPPLCIDKGCDGFGYHIYRRSESKFQPRTFILLQQVFYDKTIIHVSHLFYPISGR